MSSGSQAQPRLVPLGRVIRVGSRIVWAHLLARVRPLLGTFSAHVHHMGGSGAGHVTKGMLYGDSETELFAGVCGPAPTDVVITWAKAKKLLHIT